MPCPHFKITITQRSRGQSTVAGADSPRPMKLRQKASTGEWFLWEYSSILSGIRIPAAEDPWS